MTDNPTLATIRTNVRERADMVNSQFCTDPEINGYIQSSYKEFYDLLVEAVEDYNLLTSSFTITSGNTNALPTDFYKLRAVDDMQDPNWPRTVRKFMFGERNDYLFAERLAVGAEFSDVMYRIWASSIEFLPPDKAQRAYRLWYVPLPTIPTLDADTIDAINGFDEYVTIDAAMKCLIKEESNIAPLQAQKAALTDRIYKMRANRDQNLPEKITRVRNRRRSGFYSYFGFTEL